MNIKSLIFIFLLPLSLTLACGKEHHNESAHLNNTLNAEQEEKSSSGFYRAILRPLNIQLSGFIPSGIAEIKITEKDDEVKVITFLDDDAKVTHVQNIHTGKRCPNLTDDKNQDGFIDINEAIKASGSEMIPLDDDLNSADAGKGIYPKGSGFTYTKKASLKQLLKDTYARKKQPLNLHGRVILMRGAAPGSNIPQSVTTHEGQTKEFTIPVVCGIFLKN